MNTTDYRRNAEDCLRLAERASPEARVVLLMMAEAWLRLVQYREHDAVKYEIEPPVRAIAGEVANNAQAAPPSEPPQPNVQFQQQIQSKSEKD